jgi:hypothetical protein
VCWLSTEQAKKMPDSRRVDEQWKEQQPTPHRQPAVWLLAKDAMKI